MNYFCKKIRISVKNFESKILLVDLVRNFPVEKKWITVDFYDAQYHARLLDDENGVCAVQIDAQHGRGSRGYIFSYVVI